VPGSLAAACYADIASGSTAIDRRAGDAVYVGQLLLCPNLISCLSLHTSAFSKKAPKGTTKIHAESATLLPPETHGAGSTRPRSCEAMKGNSL
jgi:hypothetical protein